MFRVDRLSRPGLEPASFELARGGCLAIVGPSGAGKSLLLRAIADLDPGEGQVSLDGTAREAMSAPAWRRRVAYVPAESGWWADTVRAHLGDLDGAAALALRLGLAEDALGWSVSRLSTGEKQRLALVRALGQKPAVLLLDEPTGSLDGDGTAAVEALVQELRDDDMVVVLVTHDRAQAGRLADHILTMRDGRLSEEVP